MGVWDTITALLGGSPQTKTTLAPPLDYYPTKADAEYAQDYGFGYGSGNEPYLNNQQVRVFGHNVQQPVFTPPPDLDPKLKGKKKPVQPVQTQMETKFVPTSAIGLDTQELAQALGMPSMNTVIDTQNPQTPMAEDLRKIMDQKYMQAALAANRIPLAGIGFDPDRTVVDYKTGKMGGSNLAGLTAYKPPANPGEQPKLDMMYSTAEPIDAYVHEPIHRGMNKLEEKYPEEYKKIMHGNMGTNFPPVVHDDGRVTDSGELITRWLMKGLGNYEGQYGGSQIEDATKRFTDPYYKEDRAKALNDLQELAIRYRKEMHPGGPR